MPNPRRYAPPTWPASRGTGGRFAAEQVAGFRWNRWPESAEYALEDVNVFTWPGYDLRPVPDMAGRYGYGFLPPRFFQSIIERFKELRKKRQVAVTSRDDKD